MHINSCRCFYIWLQFSLHFDVDLAKICGSAASSLIRFLKNCPLLLNDNVIGVYWLVEYLFQQKGTRGKPSTLYQS